MPREEVRATEKDLGLLKKLEKQRQNQRELEEGEAIKSQNGERRCISGIVRKGRRGSALSNFAFREAEKKFENENKINMNERIRKLGPDPPYYKIQLVEFSHYLWEHIPLYHCY